VTAEREQLVQYWMHRAQEAVAEAELMAQADHWNTCVSRLCYACFYAATALLLRHGLSSKKHSGVRSAFNRHFVKSGTVAPDLGALYNELYASREQADYRDLVAFNKDQVAPWISATQQFVWRVQALLTSPAVEEPSV
jgi:uncharacterized protein